MKPLLITASSYSKTSERFIQSLMKVGNEINYLSIEFEPHYPSDISGGDWINVFELGMRVKFKDRAYPGNVARFLLIKDVIKKFGYDKNGGQWVIFTDTDDVIFQTKLPEFEPAKHIYMCAEGVTFGESSFWKPIIKKYAALKIMETWPIYNAGCFAMRMNKFMSFLEFVEKRYKTLDRLTAVRGISDQIMYNLWLHDQSLQLKAVHASLFGSLYNGMNDGRIIINEDQKGNKSFINSEKKLYCVIHGNGSTKKYL